MKWAPPVPKPLEVGFGQASYVCVGCGVTAEGTPLERYPGVTRKPAGWRSTCDNPEGDADRWSHWCPDCEARSAP